MIVRELVTRLGFDADTKQAQRYDRTMADIRTTALRAATAIAAVSTAASALVTSFVRSSSETVSWANRIGITTTELQKLQFAADRFNVSNDALIDGLKEASLRADEFIKTGVGGGSEAFERLGLSAEDLNRVSGNTAELFALIQRRIQGVDNVAARQRIADEIFGGQAGEQFTEFLGAGREETERLGRLAEQLGAIVPEESLRNARQLGREFNTLSSVFRGLGAQVASGLLPVFQDMVDSTMEWLATNRELILQNISRFVRSFASAVRTAWGIVEGIGGAIGAVVERTGGWKSAIDLAVAAITTLIGLKLASWAWGLAAALGTVAFWVRLLKFTWFGMLVLAIAEVIGWVNGAESALEEWFGAWEDLDEGVRDFLTGWEGLLTGLIALIGVKLVAAAVKARLALLATAKAGGAAAGGAAARGGGLAKGVGLFGLGALALGQATSYGNTEDELSAAERRAQQIRDFFAGLGGGSSASDLSHGMPSSASRVNNVNMSANIELAVPPGTPGDQQRSLEEAAGRTFDEMWNRKMREALWDLQPSE